MHISLREDWLRWAGPISSELSTLLILYYIYIIFVTQMFVFSCLYVTSFVLCIDEDTIGPIVTIIIF